MALEIDAKTIHHNNLNMFETIEERLNIISLKSIEEDLDIDEKISILFLMCNHQSVEDIIHCINNTSDFNNILTQFVLNHCFFENWKHKLLEAIVLINNKKIIKKLGIPLRPLHLLYAPNILSYSKHISTLKKCLYNLCEQLNENETNVLIAAIKKDIQTEYHSGLKNISSLELHILFWHDIKYINILPGFNDVNIKNLYENLKKLNLANIICEDLKQQESVLNNIRMVPTHFKNLYNIKKGLCIIINEKLFLGPQYKDRYGTNFDCENLKKTFKGLGFEVCIYNDIKREKLINIMENLQDKIYENPKDPYDCLFFCILTHGYNGGVVASDKGKISFDTMNDKICSSILKNVIKIVIIQACQGTVAGIPPDSFLTTDEINETICSDVTRFKNFCMFKATLGGYKAMRNEVEGTWFIQEICRVLQKGHPINFHAFTSEVIKSVEEKRGIHEGNPVAQLPEVCYNRLIKDFLIPSYLPQNNE
ncbi:caspase-8-like [Prorops nasuta]|uniref:caspase-8-like n=1 Tax=Prorops nasuta TaxID=863751 RepID=UPI0034CDDD55